MTLCKDFLLFFVPKNSKKSFFVHSRLHSLVRFDQEVSGSLFTDRLLQLLFVFCRQSKALIFFTLESISIKVRTCGDSLVASHSVDGAVP